jgi:hypothetical protein|tara:strand:+ start:59 stop:367 length:309 start_codon:yes stop_codon:yes gene_type:complete
MNWIKRLFSKKETTKQCDIHVVGSSFLQDRTLKIKQQELEDEMFYDNVKAEALRQINRPKGWLIDISRGRLMQIYNIYDDDTAKYKNVNSLEMCSELIDELS